MSNFSSTNHDDSLNNFYGSYFREASVPSEELTEPLIIYSQKESIIFKGNINNYQNSINFENNKLEEASVFEVVKQLKIINDYKSDSSNISFINELSNGFIVMSSFDGCLLFYTKSFEKILEIKFPFKINSLNEFQDNEKSEIIKLICCSTYYIYIIILNLINGEVIIEKAGMKNSDKETNQIYIINEFNRDYDMKSVEHVNYQFLIQLKNGLQYFCTNNGVYEGNDLLNKEEKHPKLVLFEHYIEGILINENLICFKSNKHYFNGKNLLTLFDVKSKIIINEIKGYEFNISSYLMFLLSINEKNKFLITACKKGMLIVNYNINSDDEVDSKEYFHETGTLNVNCICILNQNKDSEDEGKNNNNIFLFAGGVDDGCNMGIVKLYRLSIDNNVPNLEELQKMELGKEVNGPINFIYQLRDGNIIVSCGSGNIIFTRPNLDGYNDDDDFIF